MAKKKKKKKLTVLTRAMILGANDLELMEVDVPEWGGVIYVKTMTGVERDSLEGELNIESKGNKGMTNVRARYAVRTICDADGKLLFNVNDLELMGGKSGAALDRVFEIAMDKNKISPKDIEDTVKN